MLFVLAFGHAGDPVVRTPGDSWEYKATNGDLEQWVPAGQKQKKTPGVPWPGRQG